MRGNTQFSKHPNPPHLTSDFPVGHRSYYYCGSEHTFQLCPKRNDPRALQKMRFNMHCHKPRLYFRIDCSKFSGGANPQSHNYQPADSYSQNKRPKIEYNTYTGIIGCGTGFTLQVWMTRGGIDQSQLNQQHARFQQPVQLQLTQKNPQHIQSSTTLYPASNSDQQYQHNPHNTLSALKNKIDDNQYYLYVQSAFVRVNS